MESQLDYLALLTLYALYPTLSQKGRDEFAEIMEKVTTNSLLGDNPIQHLGQ